MMIKISGRSYTTSSSSPQTKMGNKGGSGNNKKPDLTRHIICTLLLRMPLIMLNISGMTTLLLALFLAAHVAQALPLPTNAPTCHDSSSTTTCYHVASHTSNGPSSSSSSQLDLQQLPVAFTGVDVLTRSSSSLSDTILARSMLPTALATDATVTLSSEIEANRTANANGTAANGTATADGGEGEGEQHESWLKKAITTVKGWFNRRSNGELTRYIAREAAGGGINEGGGTLDEIIERVLNAFLDHIDEADGGLSLTSTSTDNQQHQQQQHWQRGAGQGDAQDEHKRESPWDRWKIDDKQDGPVPWGNWKFGGRGSDETGARSGSLSSMLLAQRHQAVGAIERDEVLGSRSSGTSSEGQHHAGAKTDEHDVDRLRFVSFVPHIPAAASSSAKA